MKILELTGMNSTKYGGIEKFFKAMVDASPQNEYVFVYNTKPDNEDYISDMTIVGRCSISVVDNASKWQYTKKVLKLIKEFRPDVVHHHFGGEKLIAAPIIKFLHPSIKQVFTLHCELPKLNFLKKCLYECMYACMNRVIAVSDGVLHELGCKPPKAVTSYMGVECDLSLPRAEARRRLCIDDGTIVITTIGFSIQIKGFDVLAEALSLLKNPPRYKLLIIGLGDGENEKMMKITERYCLQDQIVSLGIRNDVDDILQASDFYIQISRSEAMGLSIMEAIQHCQPVIGSRVGGIVEQVFDGENGFLVPPCDAQATAVAIAHMLSNRELRRHFSDNSRSRSNSFTRTAGVNRWLKIYDEL